MYASGFEQYACAILVRNAGNGMSRIEQLLLGSVMIILVLQLAQESVHCIR